MRLPILFLLCLLLLQYAEAQRKNKGQSRAKSFLNRISNIPSSLVDQISLIGDFRNPPPPPKRPRIKPSWECRKEGIKIRSIDGSCNNLEHPEWGEAGEPYERMVTNAYEDGIGTPRQFSVNGGLLRSAREISVAVLKSVSKPSNDLSYMVMQWGQFLDHDLGATPAMTVNTTTCCAKAAPDFVYNETRDEGCFPIYIDVKKDQHFKKESCMKFSRSRDVADQEESTEDKGSLHRRQSAEEPEVREQFNSITSFIDGSMVYGSSKEEMETLRAFTDGLLETEDGNLLPKQEKGFCKVQNGSTDYCFLAGDSRVNVVPGLASLHTIFVRLHNHLAGVVRNRFPRLREMFPDIPDELTDEYLFQTARRLVYSIIQRITYNEYLPRVLSKAGMEEHEVSELSPETMGDFPPPRRGPGLFRLVERLIGTRRRSTRRGPFMGSGRRSTRRGALMGSRRRQKRRPFGRGPRPGGRRPGRPGGPGRPGRHGRPGRPGPRPRPEEDPKYRYMPDVNPMIINAFTTAAFRYGHSLIPDTMLINGQRRPLHELFFNPTPVIHHFKDVTQFLITAEAETPDENLSGELTNHLFETPQGSLDLAALNIQRGRDHGLPSLNEYRDECGLERLTSFDDPAFGTCSASLAQVYHSTDDVDLFVGALCEPTEPGASVGKVLSCIFGRQFFNLKYGDRFFYRNPRQRFNRVEKRIIARHTLAFVLCNHGGLEEVQPNVFLSSKVPGNERVKCSDLPLQEVDF